MTTWKQTAQTVVETGMNEVNGCEEVSSQPKQRFHYQCTLEIKCSERNQWQFIIGNKSKVAASGNRINEKRKTPHKKKNDNTKKNESAKEEKYKVVISSALFQILFFFFLQTKTLPLFCVAGYFSLLVWRADYKWTSLNIVFSTANEIRSNQTNWLSKEVLLDWLVYSILKLVFMPLQLIPNRFYWFFTSFVFLLQPKSTCEQCPLKLRR